MTNSRDRQKTILSTMFHDDRLVGSAKNQIRIFLDLLATDDSIGFDTTSALFYGFLNNPDFTDPSGCPLSQERLQAAKAYFHRQAQIARAHESSLIEKVASLPLANFFGGRMALKDLAVAFLTYASEVSHFTYDPKVVDPLYEYLRIPRNLYLNVYDLYYDLQTLGIDYRDFILNISPLKVDLVPVSVQSISIAHRNLFEHVFPHLPASIERLDGAALEDFIMECYDKAGFQVVRIGKRTTTPDGGVDIIAYTTPSGLIGQLKIAIQCKATRHRVGADLIRGFNTSLANFAAHKGVFVAKSGFSGSAIKEVRIQKYPIELMDYVKLTNELRRLVERK